MRVLIADDSAFMRSYISNIVRSTIDCEVFEASDGEDAVYKYKICLPDIVLIDLNMPKKGGMEAIAEIRKMGDPKVIVVTAIDQDWARKDALKKGVSGFITKPFKPDEIRRVLLMTLAAQNMR
ncbi:MAG: response regulator [Candidatus Methanosuratincola sp.]